MITVRTPLILHALTHPMGEFAGRKFGRVDLLDDQAALFAKPLQIHAHRFGAPEQEAEFLIESEQSRLLTAADGCCSELEAN